MSYWKQFAEMLGLELGEEFSLTKSNGEKVNEDTYKITEDGLLYKSQIGINWYSEPKKTIGYLLSGEYKVLPKSWKPEIGEQYWHYSEAWDEALSCNWENGFNDLLLWKSGNCFQTNEEAKAKGKDIMEQIRKEFEES